MLRPQSEQHDLPWVHVDRHDSGASGHQFLALQPARGNHIHVWIARDDAGALRVESFGELEERTVDVEPVGLGGHAVTERMLRVDLELQDRARSEMLIAAEPFFQILYRNRQ